MTLIYDMYSMYENVGSSYVHSYGPPRAVVLKKFVVCDKKQISDFLWQQQKVLIANTEMCPNKRT